MNMFAVVNRQNSELSLNNKFLYLHLVTQRTFRYFLSFSFLLINMNLFLEMDWIDIIQCRFRSLTFKNWQLLNRITCRSVWFVKEYHTMLLYKKNPTIHTGVVAITSVKWIIFIQHDNPKCIIPHIPNVFTHQIF